MKPELIAIFIRQSVAKSLLAVSPYRASLLFFTLFHNNLLSLVLVWRRPIVAETLCARDSNNPTFGKDRRLTNGKEMKGKGRKGSQRKREDRERSEGDSWCEKVDYKERERNWRRDSSKTAIAEKFFLPASLSWLLISTNSV